MTCYVAIWTSSICTERILLSSSSSCSSFSSYPKLMPYVVWRPQGSGKNILLAGVIFAWFLSAGRKKCRLKYSDSGSCIWWMDGWWILFRLSFIYINHNSRLKGLWFWWDNNDTKPRKWMVLQVVTTDCCSLLMPPHWFFWSLPTK